MRKLRSFLTFNSEEFFRNKDVQFISGTEKDGTLKINAIIIDDRTNYGKDKDGNEFVGVNAMEKFVITVPDGSADLLKQLKMKDSLELYDFGTCKVWAIIAIICL